MFKKFVAGALTVALVGWAYSVVSVRAEEEKAAEKKEEFKCVCPVSGKPAVKEATVDYKEGTIYFCCPGCPAAFKKDTAKFAAKANLQLVATGQAKQVKCPVTGRPVKKEQMVELSAVKVGFCCPNCKGKVAKAEGDAQLELVFSDTAFKKGFEMAKKEEKKEAASK